ncbi:hypothetical protein DCS_03842 [Drechmeria coniospora]|uniref:Short-chain dehydrogenase/reductase family protein n=1 Tax=Drechmeria coniospora TaxID=98403 RepID=A0A151GIB4_DRECN|nr:hypothetical protein DCS_03842 [Drechmeria coniospora]KYK56836.1 hypothetical protein DCS_03842 [Drechmeria coniospora]ODA78341.1 hypothetical protein RJ55_05722 [Drechmeria coniospora]
MSFFWKWARGQWSTLPYPDQDCTGWTVIITGANSGLGLEAARHFVRLNATKVILACRSVERGEAALREIEKSPEHHGAAEVWQLDLGSVESVKEFAARASKLDRLDVLLNNASILTRDWAVLEGHESMMTVNVISTLFLTVLLLPALRRTAIRFNVVPHVTTVSSDAAFMPFFPEKRAEHTLDALKVHKNFSERYNTTKLLQLMMMRKLAESSDASGKGHVIVNALNPGLCKTQLFRHCEAFPLSWAIWLAFVVFGRDAEMGSRTLMSAALAGEETHGKWMSDCELQVWPKVMEGADGAILMDKIWRELADALEALQPGVMENV